MALPFRVLELYSGIGGMHFALHESGILYHVIKAMDINTQTNQVYRANFPQTPVSAKSIGALQTKDLEEMNIDMMVMSPPCQPFTRMGNKKDKADLRTHSFLHFLNIFKEVSKHPSYFLVENVKGFETSDTRSLLIDTLTECGYNYQEMLLTPKQFGIPNCRLRYYLLAKLKPLQFSFKSTEEVMLNLPECPKDWLPYKLEAEATACKVDLYEQYTCVCDGHHGNREGRKSEENINFMRSSDGLHDSYSEQIEPVSTKTSEKRNYLKRPSNDISNVGSKHLKLDSSQSVCEITSNETERKSPNGCEIASNELGIKSSNDSSFELPHHLNDVQDAKCDAADSDKQTSTFSKHPVETGPVEDISNKNCLQNYGHLLRLLAEERDVTDGICLKVRHFLESNWQSVDKFKDYIVPEKYFRQLVPMDIVNPCTRKTACFTKRYGKFVTGGGSLFLMTTDIDVIEAASNLKQQVMEKLNRDSWGEQEFEIIRQLKLRYFTPQEVANLMCFPKSFSFPDGFTDKQKYSMLGNSINVHVVSVLIKLLTT